LWRAQKGDLFDLHGGWHRLGAEVGGGDGMLFSRGRRHVRHGHQERQPGTQQALGGAAQYGPKPARRALSAGACACRAIGVACAVDRAANALPESGRVNRLATEPTCADAQRLFEPAVPDIVT
jgi:hypothetical protein